MPNKALLEYRIISPEIGSVQEYSTIFLNARMHMDKKYDKKVDCAIRMVPYYDRDKPIIYIKMEEREKGSLKPALIDLFSEVGVPWFVNSGSNYDLINSVLQKHNKRLQRKFKGGGAGKHVVELNS